MSNENEGAKSVVGCLVIAVAIILLIGALGGALSGDPDYGSRFSKEAVRMLAAFVGSFIAIVVILFLVSSRK